jgi:putative nucleotidyltransferase with HDIG domain
MPVYKPGELVENQIINHLHNGDEMIIESYTLPHKEEDDICEVLRVCIDELEKEPIYDYLLYIVKELLTNAKKANSKRIYFSEKKLDISNPVDYQKGMRDFSRTIFEHADHYLQQHKEWGLTIRTSMQMVEDYFVIKIINNTQIMEGELKVAQEKLRRSKIFNSFEEASSLIFDSREGAGLGFIIIILMLKKIGLTREEFDIRSEQNKTVTEISIPLSLITEEQSQTINDLLSREIKDIPQFPENVILLQEKLQDPEVDLKEVSTLISRDPSLTAGILKLSNSAEFMLPKRVTSIIEAIKYIGIKGLRNLIYTYASQKILESRYNMEEMKKIWAHSYKVGFYAFYLAKKNLTSEDREDAFIGGLLHDLGKILIFAINPDIVKAINTICHTHGIPVRVIEEVTSGYNHSLIGAKLAEKWNFPEKLVTAIQYHHRPLSCDDKYKEYVFCIYMANILAQDELTSVEKYEMTENTILYYFSITSQEEYDSLQNELTSSYVEQKHHK